MLSTSRQYFAKKCFFKCRLKTLCHEDCLTAI